MLILSEKYNDQSYVDRYASVWAYGYLNGMGEAEGLYRTVNSLGFELKQEKELPNILDIGCGVGRTSCDYARHFHRSKIISIDSSMLMIEMARRIVCDRNKEILFELGRFGLMNLKISSFGLSNVDFIRASLEDFDRLDSGVANFDLITSVNFIDRSPDVRASVQIIYNLLDCNGVFIGCTPLNFLTEKDWDDYGSSEKLRNLFLEVGFKVDVIFDKLVYREVLDGRGSYEDYNTLVFRLLK